MIGTIIQARMGSSRLPGKVLRGILGKPMLGWQVGRVRCSRLIEKIVVATTTRLGDDPIAEFCDLEGIDCFRGSEEDVLDRYFRAAAKHGLDSVVRITADCPLIDPVVSDRVIEAFVETGCEYACNNCPPTYPDGLDTEVFSMAALRKGHQEARAGHHREHVTPYFVEQPQLFKLVNVRNERDLSYLRWTVDYEDDFAFVTEVFKSLSGDGRIFGMAEVLELLQARPEIREINRGHVRNEWELKTYGRRPYEAMRGG